MQMTNDCEKPTGNLINTTVAFKLTEKKGVEGDKDNSTTPSPTSYNHVIIN